MKTILSYNSDEQLKTDLLQEVERHEKADMIIQGSYGKMNGHWRGCAVGCSIHSLNEIRKKDYATDDHTVYPKEFGIPLIIARLQDRIFEDLPKERAMKFPFQFLAAIPIGKDLDHVWRKFFIWLLVDPTEGVIKYAKRDQTKKAIQGVADLLERSLTEKITTDQFAAVRNAAWEARDVADAAAADAAYAYAYADAAAADAAYAYAYAVADAAAYAYAYAVADAAAYAAADARKQKYMVMADKLILLLQEA